MNRLRIPPNRPVTLLLVVLVCLSIPAQAEAPCSFQGAIAAIQGVINGFRYSRDQGIRPTWKFVLETLEAQRAALQEAGKKR